MRTDWDHYFMEIALQVATRASCDRKHVGAVIVRDRVILSTGYNGSVRGTAHCSHVGHMLEGAPEELWEAQRQLLTHHDCNPGGALHEVQTLLETGIKHLTHCVRTVHAEANAIIQAAKNGVRIDGATLYTTAFPCWPCFKLIANAGIQRVVYGESYRQATVVIEAAAETRIELVDLTVRMDR